jgi:hypothetical protein
MKKNYLFVEISFFILLLLVLCIVFSCNKYFRVRPIKIQVIDSKTNKPVDNILVYYFLEVEKPKNNFDFFPPLDGGGIKEFIYKKKLYTNINGEITINLKDYKFLNDFYSLQEYICINLDIVDKLPPNYNDRGNKLNNFVFEIKGYIVSREIFINPNTQYKGYYIFNPNFVIDNPKDWGNPYNTDYRRWDKFNAEYNSKGLLNKKSEVIVKLEQYSNKHENAFPLEPDWKSIKK